MLQGKQRQPRISQQAVHAACVFLALFLAVFLAVQSALKVHTLVDARYKHHQRLSLRLQALQGHLGVEPGADLQPQAVGGCSTAVCVSESISSCWFKKVHPILKTHLVTGVAALWLWEVVTLFDRLNEV